VVTHMVNDSKQLISALIERPESAEMDAAKPDRDEQTVYLGNVAHSG